MFNSVSLPIIDFATMISMALYGGNQLSVQENTVAGEGTIRAMQLPGVSAGLWGLIIVQLFLRVYFLYLVYGYFKRL